VLARGERADDRDLLPTLAQRQDIALVLQKDDRLLRHLARKRQRRLGAAACGFAFLVDAAERVLEQAELGLDRQHLADRFIDPRHRHLALLDQVGQVIAIEAAGHAHIDPGHEGDLGRLAGIGGKAVVDHLHVAGIIGNDEALIFPLVAQHGAHQPLIAVRGDSGNLVERGHGRQCARAERRLEGREIDFAQRPFRHVDGVVIKPRFRRAISGEVLRAGHHRIDRLEAGALEALHARRGEEVAEMHVLARALHGAAPALVACDVDHRREGPVDARGSGLVGCSGRSPFRQSRIEARGFAHRNREDGAVAVNDIRGEDQRDLEPRLLHRRSLHDPAHMRTAAVEHAGEHALADFLDLLFEVGVRAAGRVDHGAAAPGRSHQAELARLFGERHLGDQRVDERRNLDRCSLAKQRMRRAVEPRRDRTSAHQRRAAGNPGVEHF